MVENLFDDISKDKRFRDAKDYINSIINDEPEEVQVEQPEQIEVAPEQELFEGDDQEKFEKLMVDITGWIEKYAGLFDETDPKTLDFLNLLDDIDAQI